MNKNTATTSKLIIAVYASYVSDYISCTCYSGRLEYNSLFVGRGVWVWGAMSKKFGGKSEDEVAYGLNV
jgi:hypothetical protein